ncbi:U4/U6.U5 snRNP associated protein [Coemansia nantahalensis]|uniref:U4/U6.U5 snRNP associated protein n=1 Tax=Coemansia nantahalensis TaxID=2789366 RepID=A0ACC1K3P6_9FUNG|nr:U4/U6.U5 snRNP associated protein [Coemansia nantahalensis]KAJ2774230.1 U4/U6.U5 snRNP associated protein [Coemansia nantahalensis]
MAKGDKTAYGERRADGFRRTWDNSAYEKKAQDREQQQREADDNDERRRKGLKPRPARAAWTPRELLQARTGTVNLEGMVGKTQVVEASAAAGGQPGFYCKVCDVTVKDSLSYLDHINGKKHQRLLNRTMAVAVETVDDVLAKLAALRQRAARRQQQDGESYDFYERVRVQQDIEARKKQKRREARQRYRQAKRAAGDGDDSAGEAAGDELDGMASLMGFAAFGSSKK